MTTENSGSGCLHIVRRAERIWRYSPQPYPGVCLLCGENFDCDSTVRIMTEAELAAFQRNFFG